MKRILIALLLVILIPTVALAWDDCVNGETDCKYPGSCGRYVNTDNDQICDHSQSAPADREVDVKDESDEPIGITESNLTEEDTSDENNKQSDKPYHLVLIAIILVVLYLITFVLSKKKIISVVNHKKIWNILLLISFLVSGILGVLLIIQINFETTMSPPFNMLFWHVEVGIAMFVICVFHIIERFGYFVSLFKIKK